MSYKVSSICMKVISVISFLLFLQPVSAQYNWTQLDAELRDKQQILGNNVVALIWKGDSLIYKKEMGGFNSNTQAPIASCSKWLTAALVMQFVDAGKLSLDDKVAKYIPEFEKDSKKSISIRQCLCHMTGITDDDKFLKRLLQRRKLASLEEEVNEFAARDSRTRPGTDFWYGNVGLNIAGRVLEVISKEKFENLVQTKLFTPLGMSRTSFSGTGGGPVNPSGGAKSTADDYMKFLMMLLNKGKYKGVQVLSEDAVNQMMQVQDKPEQIKYAPKAALGFTYALGGWVIEEKKGVATSIASPGLFGTWPMIDFCRGYAYLVFVKNLLGEERADVHKRMKKIVDKQIVSSCQ
ncbi:MAG: serine hydrolase domain-containing protein [Chitinophagaceae bacterium]